MTLKQNLTILMESREKQSFWHTIFFFFVEGWGTNVKCCQCYMSGEMMYFKFFWFFAYSIEACICKAFSLNLPDADMLV